MNSQKQTVLNPKTNRPIVVGGRVYMKLLREGLIENPNIKDDNILYEIEQEPEQPQEQPQEQEPEQELEPLPLERSESVINELPPHQQAVKGRGKYKGKMVRRNKQLKPAQVHQQIADCAVRAVKKYQNNHSNHFTDNEGDNDNDENNDENEDLDKLIHQMIMDEMVNNNNENEDYEIEDSN